MKATLSEAETAQAIALWLRGTGQKEIGQILKNNPRASFVCRAIHDFCLLYASNLPEGLLSKDQAYMAWRNDPYTARSDSAYKRHYKAVCEFQERRKDYARNALENWQRTHIVPPAERIYLAGIA